jgi:molybdopterin converting factor small subunit
MPGTSSFTVLLFASYADRLKASELTVDLPAGATVQDLIAVIRGRPNGDTIPPTPLVAVNERYAPPGQVLAHGDEVALIPATAGG